MTTKEIIEGMTAWADEHICSKIQLKLPDDASNDSRYTLKYVKPAAFPLFVPAKDRIPPSVEAPIPSIAVQMMEGSDLLTKGERTMRLRLCLSTWNPGHHPGENFVPVQDNEELFNIRYEKESESKPYFRHSDGWKDLYNFQDIALRELETELLFSGVSIDMNEPVTYGPFTEDGVIWDYYPYWNGWISFTVKCGTPFCKSEELRELLD